MRHSKIFTDKTEPALKNIRKNIVHISIRHEAFSVSHISKIFPRYGFLSIEKVRAMKN